MLFASGLGRKLKAESGEWRAKSTEQKAEGRRQKAEGRRQKAEGRRQKAEGKKEREGRRLGPPLLCVPLSALCLLP
jgi:hypothetical protein